MRHDTRVLPPELLDELRKLLGDRLTTDQQVREHHGTDISSYPVTPPDAVVFPAHDGRSRRDRQRLRAPPRADDPVRRRHFGRRPRAGRHAAACASTSAQMNRIVEVNASDLDVRVEPGVTRKQLNAYLHDTGLFFPIDPGADATLGGMASTRASGTNAVRYGTMRENVLGVDGRAGRRPRDPHRRTRAQVRRRLRPHAPLRRRRGHARHHHRAHVAPVRDPRGTVGRRVRVSDGDGGRRLGDRGDPVRHPDRAGRAARHAHGDRGQPLQQARAARGADALVRIPRHARAASRSRRRRCRRSRASTAASTSNGRRARRSARGCGRRGTTPTSRACSCARAAG